jgi:hypothetical protein
MEAFECKNRTISASKISKVEVIDGGTNEASKRSTPNLNEDRMTWLRVSTLSLDSNLRK